MRIFVRKISAKNTNVAIKRVKSNAPALAISSDSNIDEVNHAKVQKRVYKLSTNVEFLEVAFTLSDVNVCNARKIPHEESIKISRSCTNILARKF